jgi:predicted site-specific integrase-resolvase
MAFFKNENLAEVSRNCGIPYATLYWWVRTGRIVLPRDLDLLGQLRRSSTGRYYQEEMAKND